MLTRNDNNKAVVIQLVMALAAVRANKSKSVCLLEPPRLERPHKSSFIYVPVFVSTRVWRHEAEKGDVCYNFAQVSR